jgi:exosortase A
MISFTDRAWRDTLIRLSVVALVVGVAFRDTWFGMYRVWMSSETFGHGIAVAPIALWLVWREREHWLKCSPSSSWLGLPLIALGAVAWLLAEIASVGVVAQYAAVAILIGLVLCSVGPSVIRHWAFSLGFLFLMVPAGEWLNGPLMEGTASATVAVMRLVGIPVFRDGMFFSLPSGQWSVVEACSGLRYVLVAVMLGILFARLNFTRVSRQVAFVLVALVLAVVANWMRAWLIVTIGHLSQMRYGTGEDHVWYGWAFFGVVMFGLFWMGARWREQPASPKLAAQGDGAGLTRMARPVSSPASGRIIGGFALGVCLTIAAPVLAHRLLQGHPPDLSRIEGHRNLPIVEAASLQIPVVMEGARWAIQGQDRSDVPVEIALAYFAQQADGHEMIAYGNGLPAQHGHWTRTGSSQGTLSLGGQAFPVRWVSYRPGEPLAAQRMVLLFYVVSGTVVATESLAKIHAAWSVLRGQGDHSMLVSISVPVVPRSGGQLPLDLPAPALEITERVLRFARQATAPQ